MTHFNVTSSQIITYSFPNCPLTVQSEGTVNIKDVQFDVQGNPCVAYRDPLGALFIVNNAGYNGSFKTALLYSTLDLSLNLSNNTFIFVGIQLTSFVIERVSIASGTVLTKVSVPVGTRFTNVFKVDAQYFMLAYTESGVSKFQLWDCVNLIKITTIQSNSGKAGINPMYSGFVYGFYPDAPTNFSGVLFYSYPDVFLMNSQGSTLVYSPGVGQSIFDVVPVSQSQFFVSQVQVNLIGIAMYQIVNWGFNNTYLDIKSNYYERKIDN
jgi:hypothetical protein